MDALKCRRNVFARSNGVHVRAHQLVLWKQRVWERIILTDILWAAKDICWDWRTQTLLFSTSISGGTGVYQSGIFFLPYTCFKFDIRWIRRWDFCYRMSHVMDFCRKLISKKPSWFEATLTILFPCLKLSSSIISCKHKILQSHLDEDTSILNSGFLPLLRSTQINYCDVKSRRRLPNPPGISIVLFLFK